MIARDAALGMGMSIDRRDFLDGVALGTAALAIGGAAPAVPPSYYPPLLTGLRGSHPGSFEAAHALRDGNSLPAATPTGETYDLVIVGSGISGLAAAWFHRAANPGARILILDNHDDFGGHAKRNEFHLGGKLPASLQSRRRRVVEDARHRPGGTDQGIDAPRDLRIAQGRHVL
jgi:spermidine dehydrogenase